MIPSLNLDIGTMANLGYDQVRLSTSAPCRMDSTDLSAALRRHDHASRPAAYPRDPPSVIPPPPRSWRAPIPQDYSILGAPRYCRPVRFLLSCLRGVFPCATDPLPLVPAPGAPADASHRSRSRAEHSTSRPLPMPPTDRWSRREYRSGRQPDDDPDNSRPLRDPRFRQRPAETPATAATAPASTTSHAHRPASAQPCE